MAAVLVKHHLYGSYFSIAYMNGAEAFRQINHLHGVDEKTVRESLDTGVQEYDLRTDQGVVSAHLSAQRPEPEF